MHHKALLYSLDPKITSKQIQEQEHITYDSKKYIRLQQWVTEHGVWSMMSLEIDFHYKLLAIRPRVHLIYYIGNIWLLNKKMLGIVGPRKMSSYGKRVVEALFPSLSGYDVVTISGMAEGVDQLCHQLSHEHALPTIAVLGWGLGRYMRRPEGVLIKQIIAAGGLVLSEYKLWEKPTQYTFPQRNRLIAWLADVIFLPEAGKKSGSLITVDCAIAMKKPVYATPNSIFAPTSEGILHYMEIGYVKPILTPSTFLARHFTSTKTSSRPTIMISLTDQEQWLLSVLSRDQWVAIQELVQTNKFAIQEIIQMLTMLEIKGLVCQEAPGKYVLV